jgi:autotransporter-associated beta strand protein
MKRRPLSAARLFVPLTAALVAVLSVSSANATPYTWTSTATTGPWDWTTATNWAASTQYVSDAANELIFFSDSTTNIASANRSITTNVPVTLEMNTLTLNGKGASSGASSSAITIGSSASTWTIGDGTTSIVNLNANQGATTAAGWNYNVAANLALNQANTLFTGNGTGGVHTGVTDTGFVFSGAIGQAAAGYGITKSGSSRLTLSSSSLSFTGGITVDGGSLFLTGNSNVAGLVVNSGAILRIGNNTATQLGVAGIYANNISTGTGGTLQLYSTAAQEFSGVISGAGGIQKAYGGALTLSGANTYTGKTQFTPVTTAGFTVNVSSFNNVVGGTASSSLGAPTTVANGTIDLGSGSAQAGVNLTYVTAATGETTDRVININFNGSASQTITASNASGVLRFTSAFTSNAPTTQSGQLILRGTGQGQIDQGLPQLGTGGLNKNDAGTWTLGGSGNFTGPTVVTAGTLSLSSATALQLSLFNTASVAGGASAGLKIATTTLTLGGLTGSNSFDSRFHSASSVLYSGLTALTLTNASNTTSTYSGGLAANSMTLTKTGAGTQFLNGTNSHTGLTTVSGGTLGSNGTFSGAVTASNGGILSPGASAGAIGTMTISDASASALTLNGGYLQMDVSTASKDLIAVTGNTVVNGTNTVLLNPTTGVAAGTYDIVTHAGTTGSGSVVFANGSTTLGNATLAVNAGNIRMTVGAGDLNNSVWVGTTATWDSGTNWNRNGTAGQAFAGGDFATIDDTGSNAANITSAGTVSPAQLTFNNSTKNFVVTATIGGTGTPLVKMGTAQATLGSTTVAPANSYSGGTVVLGGTLNLAGATNANVNYLLGDAAGGITLNGGQLRASGTNVIGARNVTVLGGGGSLFVNKNNNFTTTGILSGSGTLTLLDGGGSGTLSTYNFNSTSNDFTGGMVLNNAIVNTPRFDDNTNNIVFNVSIAATSGSNVNSLPGLKYANGGSTPLTLSSRSIELNSAVGSGIVIQNNNTSQPITISSNPIATGAGAKILMLDAAAGPTNVFSGNITDGTGGGTVSVVKPSTTGASGTASTSVWVLSGTNSYTGTTTISTGTLAGIGPNAFGSTSGIRIAGAGILSLRGDSSTNFVKASDSSLYSVTTTASGATINVDAATGNTSAKTMAIGTLGSSSTAAGYQVNFTGANNTSLNVGAVTGSISTAAATVTLNNTISSTGQLSLASYTSANTAGGETLILTGTGIGNISGAITPGATTLSLQKSNGTGTWVLSGSSSHTGTTVINGGTLQLGNGGTTGSLSATGAITNNGNLTINRSNAFTQAADLNGQAINGTGSFTQAGGGITTLSASNGYTGATNVNAGTLLINGSTSSSSAVTVAAGATLGGTGSIGGIVTTSGILSPGASIETLSSSSLSFLPGSSFAYETNSSIGAATGADLMKVTGNVSLTGTVVLTITDLAASPAAYSFGTKFSLLNYTGTWVGQFTYGGNPLAEGDFFTEGLNTWQITYSDTSGGQNYTTEYAAGNFVNITAIPEPRAALLGSLGVFMLFRRRRTVAALCERR